MSKITIVNIVIGIWWGAANILLFYTFMGGKYIHEPNLTMATIEFITAIIGTGWFLWQIPYWWIKLRRRKKESK